MIRTRPTTPTHPTPRRCCRAGRHGGISALVLLTTALACEEVVVRPADVDSVVVEPALTKVAVDGTVRLSANVYDADGARLSGLTVSWASGNDAVAAVDGEGTVTGLAVGETEIEARVGGRTGSATVEVLRPAVLELSRASIDFSEAVGAADPPAVEVSITNGGDMPLTALTVDVEYHDGSGWLTATLAGTSAPTSLSVAARLAGLGPGTYEATVRVDAGSDAVEAADIDVNLEVRAGAPGSAPDLVATATSGQAEIKLSWTDPSSEETGFRIERRGPGEAAFSRLATPGANVVAYTDGAVEPDGTYVYRVAACTAAGCSGFSNEASSTTYPLAPAELDAEAESDSRIRVSWTDNSASETGFRIERKTTGGFSQVATVGIDQTSYSDTGLSPETSYAYRVRACNTGGCSGYTAETGATTSGSPAPSAPSGVTAEYEAAGDRIALAWSDNSSDESSFRIERKVDSGSFTSRATVGANVVQFPDDDIEPDHVYTYRVVACAGSSLCSDHSNEASATTPPISPSGLTTSSISVALVALVWVDNSRTETRFEIQRSIDGGSFADIASPSKDATAYSDAGVSAGLSYRYRIRACNGSGCSAWSSSLSVATPPATPGGLSATALSSTEIGLSWNDVGTETRYEVEVKGAGSTRLDTVAADAEAHVAGGLRVATAYEFRIRACNANGCSPFSSSASATTRAIAAPSGLAATTVGAGTAIELEWTDNADDETRYEVQRDAGGGLGFAALETLGTDAESHTDDAVAPDGSYTYRVRACNAGGCSSFSGTASAATPPAAPTGLAVDTVTPSAVVLTWNDNSVTETGFQVERRNAGGDFTRIGTTGAGITEYSDGTSKPDSVYTYRVRACNGSLCSGFSNTVEARTPPAAASNVDAEVWNPQTVRITWSDNSSTETAFRIERDVNGDGFTSLTSVSANTVQYQDKVTPGQGNVYTYRVIACNGSICAAAATSNAVAVP